MKYKTLSAAILSLSLVSISTPALSNDANITEPKNNLTADLSAAAQSNYREGKIEGALLINKHLNNFKIDVEVNDNQAVLSGKVNSSAEKDLAGEIADSIDGIDSVDNKLSVIKEKKDTKTDEKQFSTIKDATITASVKVKLLANSNVSGININVDTSDSTVTLKGDVSSDIESDLAEKIAGNVENVKSVNNKLKVKPS